MSDYSHILKKQIADHLHSFDAEAIQGFINAVNESYKKFDMDQRTLEHSLTMSARELVQANEEISAVFQAIPDQLFHLDKEARIISYQSGHCEHYYIRSERLINQLLYEVIDPEVVDKFSICIKQVLHRGMAENFEFVIVHDRKIYYYEARLMPLKDGQILALVRDITERKLASDQIAYLAYHDSLTGLPNNRLFKDRLGQAISHAKRNKKILAVMFLDLDRFKLINDTMGHGIGDQLLQVTSDRLTESVRDTDSVAFNRIAMSSSVARLGGDEFTVLLEDIDDIVAVNRVAKRIIDNVSRPLFLNNHELYISTSIGIAVYPNDGEDVDALLRNADSAMYYAKDEGRNNFQFFTGSMNKTSMEQLVLENSLRKALQNNELFLHYQPQIDIKSQKITGVEALIRWKHPEKGFISPAVFIPVAEDTGLIMEIGEWVITEACKQGAKWVKAGYKPIKMSVNLSAKQLKADHLCEFISNILTNTGMQAEYLGVELTETAIIMEPEMALARLKEVKALGVELSMDDFGTGYSSLSYLKRFPIDVLKIDQSFIRDIKVDQESALLVKAIIAMAHGMGMEVVAEGVEQQEQLEFLRVNNCDTMQGYFFSRPVAANEIDVMLEKN
ncbi:MAG: EAL domain-containing protein [Gammaproteobacteria bacterium]|nr:EAL domain-containing protein [Gammaproteobacteria bacterium]